MADMKKKMVALLSDHPYLKQKSEEGDAKVKAMKERAEWLNNAGKKLETESQEFRKELWDGIVKYLREKDMLPKEYAEDHYGLTIDDDLGMILMIPIDKRNPLEKLKDIMG